MASLTLDSAPAVALSAAGVNDSLLTSASGRKVTYCGIPSREIYRHRQGHDPSHGVPLDPRHDLANLGPSAVDRSDSEGSRLQLSFAMLADFLGNPARALRVHREFACAIVNQTPIARPWLMTESDVAEALAAAENISGLLWDEKRGQYTERASPDRPAETRLRRIIKSRKSQS